MIAMDPDSQDMLDSELYVYESLASKADLVAYYKETYHRQWKQRLVHDLAPITNMKPKNLEKRFDPSRLNSKTSKANAEQYKKLGEQLPPRKDLRPGVKGKQARVSATVYITISNTYGKRNIDVTLSRKNTERLLFEGGIDAIIDQYGIDPLNVENVDIGEISVDFI